MGFDRCAFHCSTRHSNSANDKRRQRCIGMDADVSQFLLKLYRAGRDSVREFSGLMPHLIEAHRNSRLLQLRPRSAAGDSHILALGDEHGFLHEPSPRFAWISTD